MSVINENATRIRIVRAIIVLAAFTCISTTGFYVLGNTVGQGRSLLHAIYLTAMIFSTVGSIPDKMTTHEEIWTVLMIVFGIGAAVYWFSTMMALVTEGELRRAMGKRQKSRRLRHMNDHMIVAGFGRMGSEVCRMLHDNKRPFVLIDTDPERIALAESLRYVCINGDASDEPVLTNASIDSAAGLVTCLPNDAANVFVALTARGMNESLNIIARSESEAAEGRLIKAGATRVVSPAAIGATKIARMLMHPALEDLIDATANADLSIDRLSTDRMKEMLGKTLRHLSLPAQHGVSIMAVEKADGQRFFSPSADHVLEEGDSLIVFGPQEAVEKLLATYEA